MADIETGFNITVGAEADVNSAEKAAKDLTKGVLSSLKDGYIEVPAEIKVPIKNASKELEKAQKDVISQWKKTFKEGFSSSAKDLDNLTEAYQRFKRLAGKEHKAGTKQYKEISKLMGGQIQSYNTQKQAREMKQIQQKMKVEKTKSKRLKNFNIPSKEEIDANIKNEKKRRMRGLRSVLPAGYGKSWINAGNTNAYEMHMSEISGHPSSMVRQMSKSEKESQKWMKSSLKTDKYKTKEELEAEVEQRRANDKKIPQSSRKTIIEEENGKNVFKDMIETWETSWNREARVLSPMEKAKGLSDDIRNNILPQLLTRIQTSVNDKEVGDLTEKFFDTLDAISKLNRDAGKSILSDVKSDIGIVMGKLGFSVKGKIGGTDGKDKTDPSRDPKVVPILRKMLDDIAKKEEMITQEIIAAEQSGKTTRRSKREANSYANKLIAETHADKTTQSKLKAMKELSGFEKLKDVMCPCEKVLQSILAEIKTISKYGINISHKEKESSKTKPKTLNENIAKTLQSVFKPSQLALPSGLPVPVEGTLKSYYEGKDLYNDQKIQKILETDSKRINFGSMSRSTIATTLKDPAKWITRLKDTFADLTNTTANYKKVMASTSKEQDDLTAKRIKEYGFDRGRNVTGDKILFARSMSLWRGKDRFKDLFKDLKLTEGVNIDTTEVTDKLGKVLTGRQMRNAQMGGSPLRQIFGSMTLFAGMPSVEKSRATADALNQINANIRETLNNTLVDIQDKESALAGMAESGDLKLGENGEVLESSTVEAKTLAAQLENTKLILDSILADMGMVDKTISKSHGRISTIMKNLSFASPALRKNNTIVNNINAGYDKSGKALRFQTKTAEILNYTFKSMTRHIGRMLKNFILMTNPMSLIKRAFSDFMSYDIKWKRTMNVIKYNLRSVLKPFMEWIAQKLVNVIGFVDIISMKIQSAFGKVPVSLFDQVAADAEKTAEEIQSVSAGFDELHDIGSDSAGENDLFGEIYKPQLSQGWIDLANKIGDLFAGLIKGDLGFGEVMKTILSILWDSLKLIAKGIWDWFKQTSIGKYLTENWKKILATILGVFLGWKLLKIAGAKLFEALFGKFTSGAIGSVFSKIGGWILKALGATAFGRGIIQGITGIFTGSGGLLKTLQYAFTYPGLITQMGGWGEMLGMIFAQGLLATVGVAIAGLAIKKGTDKVKSNTAYNTGLMEYGGDEKDKKSNLGAILGTTAVAAGGGALSGLAIGAGIGAIGGPLGAAIGAAIGGIAALIATSLAPAFEQAEIAARNMNNEMQKIEYYQGQVQGAQTQVNVFSEQLQLLKQALDYSTQSVYDQGEKLGINKTRMDELIKATQDGTFNTSMLTGKELELSDSLTNLAQKQEHAKEVSEKLEEAQKRLLKAQTELSIAQDVEAGNFELAAARIEVAEAQGVYSTEQATAKRIQLYKEAGQEERDNLLQDLTDEQRTRMGEYMATTKEGLGKLSEAWEESSDNTKRKILDAVGPDVQNQLEQNMNSMDATIKRHTSVWQKIGDTLKEVFGSIFGINPTTWTYNSEDKYYKEAAKSINSNSDNARLYSDADIEEMRKRKLLRSYAVGTNYVPSDGLAYLHQGEAVVPKKYNQPYQQGMSAEERAYMQQMVIAMRSLDTTMKQGIPVNGEFKQRGSDLVAIVNKTSSQSGADLLSNVAYAR